MKYLIKKHKSQSRDINQQIFKESIQDNIKAINRIINLYDSQFMQEAKTFLNHAQELILKGLAAND
jgi:DNA-binding MurR/RpiR family transcriptional regulator